MPADLDDQTVSASRPRFNDGADTEWCFLPPETTVTIPFERTRALIHTYELLKRLQDPKETPRVPRWLRVHAKALLRHYPDYASIELAHKALPHLFGPAPPFSRLIGSADVQGVIDATKDKT
jgi:hypothetical protein